MVYATTTLLNEYFSIQQGKVNPAPGRCLLYHVTSSNICRCKRASKKLNTARTWFNPEYRYLCKADKLVRHILEKCVNLTPHPHLQAGFLSRSPKITIFLDGSRPALPSSSSNSASSGNMSVKTLGTWNCPICSFQNTGDLEKCQLCGVPKPANIQITKPTSTAPSARQSDENACPVCTFVNHPSMVRCEMCDTEIATSSPTLRSEHVTSSPFSTIPPPEETSSADSYIKIALRAGGYTTCLNNLKAAIGAKAWEQVRQTAF